MWGWIQAINKGIMKEVYEKECRRVYDLSQLLNAVGVVSYDEGLPEFDRDIAVYVRN